MTAMVHTAASWLLNCNLRFCFFGALAAIGILRTILAIKSHKHDVASEHGIAGLIHLIAAFFAS